jgi:hypothetical protein
VKKTKIALTINEISLNESIYANGAGQNAVFLFNTLSKIPEFDVFFISEENSEPISDRWERYGIPADRVRQANSYTGGIDVLIEVLVQISISFATRVSANGGALVKYEMGNKYVFNIEAMIKGKLFTSNSAGIFFDAIWTTPQHVKTCKSFLKYDYNCNNFIVMPHIWSSLFVDAYFEPKHKTFKRYTPGRDKRISVFEPNMNIVKMSIIPMIILHNAYPRAKDRIKEIYITNTSKVRELKKFKILANKMEPTRAGIVSFEGRFVFPMFSSKYTDIVLSHQWENGLNYLYLDALYLGHPFVHNSEFLRDEDVGYFYPDFDADAGADALIRAITEHDENIEEYEEKSKKFIWKHSVDNPNNYTAYESEIYSAIATVHKKNTN